MGSGLQAIAWTMLHIGTQAAAPVVLMDIANMTFTCISKTSLARHAAPGGCLIRKDGQVEMMAKIRQVMLLIRQIHGISLTGMMSNVSRETGFMCLTGYACLFSSKIALLTFLF